MASRRKKTVAVQLQLELALPKPPGPAPRPPGVWEAVAALPEAVRREHLRRKKLCKPKPRQADILEPPPDD